jgi:hypothetical protein
VRLPLLHLPSSSVTSECRGLDDLFPFPIGEEFFLFTATSISASLCIQCLLRAVFLVVKRQAGHSPPSAATAKNAWSLTSTRPHALYSLLLQNMYKYTFLHATTYNIIFLLLTFSSHLSIYLSICLWLCSRLFDLGSFFSFLTLYTVGRTPWTGITPLRGRYYTQNKRTQTTMPRVGFEPTIPAFERAKTVHWTPRPL